VERFPLNRPGATVKQRVFADLAMSQRPLIIAGYGSLGTIVEFLAAMPRNVDCVRLLIGSEPAPGGLDSRRGRLRPVAEEAREYWLSRNFSILQCLDLLRAIETVKAGRVEARSHESVHRRLHAKVFVGDGAVTLGSSNFTRPGLETQWEANVRFERSETGRYREACAIADNYWQAGSAATADLLSLLEALLRVVPWQEALARACLELLDGEWARAYLERYMMPGDVALWPSQIAGIAQALWVLDTTGSVLVADATGAGKTRMGAHLLRAIADRGWRSGRMRSARTMLVGPPSVRREWEHEASLAAAGIRFRSHGELSRTSSHEHDNRVDEVRRAQVLAVDEAHNFLNHLSNRTRVLLGNLADHTVLFTATPINRSATDLLRLADMLGADNLAESTVVAFERFLGARRIHRTLTPKEIGVLREELRRFTVRRTKRELNAWVERDPDRYRDSSGRLCRYPVHRTQVYALGETADDRGIAGRIDELAQTLRGMANLRSLELPDRLRTEGMAEETYLAQRLNSAQKLCAYQLRAALRSSVCALIEHIAGTRAAIDRFGLDPSDKRSPTGNVRATLQGIAGQCPENKLLYAVPPIWLTDSPAHRLACEQEVGTYDRILELALQLSSRRDDAKAALLRRLAGSDERVLAFDSRPITLARLQSLLHGLDPTIRVVRATGDRAAERREAMRLLSPKATPGRVVLLASDAMSEGINLQGASVIVHLDMPSVVRIAEQRVGRVDRMNSPHDAIDVYWPQDAREFALRSDEKFLERYETVEALLGSNMPLPAEMLAARDREVVDPREFAEETEREESTWDGIEDAFAPVRALVEGPTALVERVVVDAYRGVGNRVLSRVSVLKSSAPWALVCLAGTDRNAPRWIYVEPGAPLVTRLDHVVARLREHLAPGPESRPLSDESMGWLTKAIHRIQLDTPQLIPRRKQVALDEMALVVRAYFQQQAACGHGPLAEELRALADAIEQRDSEMDWDAVADTWLEMIRPTWYERLASRRGSRPVLLKDIRHQLIRGKPLDAAQVVAAFRALPTLPSLESRVAACILGVP
jgi:hypothetical protein